MKPVKLFFALLVAVPVGLYRQISETSHNGHVEKADNWIIPNVGTKYVYEFRPNDTAAPALDTFTIIKTGQHVCGKTNVVISTVSFRGRVDTAVYNIESNGDFSLGIASEHAVDSMGHILPEIIYIRKTFPIYSRKTVVALPPRDSHPMQQATISQHPMNALLSAPEMLKTASRNIFDASRKRNRHGLWKTSLTDSLRSYTDSSFTDIWFAPMIGLYVKWGQHAVMNRRIIPQANINLVKYSPAIISRHEPHPHPTPAIPRRWLPHRPRFVFGCGASAGDRCDR